MGCARQVGVLRVAFVCVQGFVCLMQLSTRHEDFVIDALALRSHIGAL